MIVKTSIIGTTAVISPHGDIDFDSLPHLVTAADELPAVVTRVIWDFQAVSFIDSAGLDLLTCQRRTCQALNRTLTVSGLPGQGRRLLSLSEDLFPTGNWDDFIPADTAA
ncbi:STAS domain-containing protein [Streptomyces sp. NPDC095817]|uniref:STAS domain-containing protein n=1 Tax=Streptomyces sp. NPDC095817 TaxID=3155082 RepID=UPI00331B2946